MWFIGDVHMKFSRYMELISNMDKSIQVGDFGIGFPDVPYPEKYDLNHRFIRGNHDNPEVCFNHPNCIKDGTFEDGMFFVGGAFSVDYRKRVEGFDWWEKEEVSYQQASEILELYEAVKPSVVVTHDCPSTVMVAFDNITKTRQLLDAMFDIHQPEVWVFGHHHKSIEKRIQKTFFKGLNELEVFEI